MGISRSTLVQSWELTHLGKHSFDTPLLHSNTIRFLHLIGVHPMSLNIFRFPQWIEANLLESSTIRFPK